MGRWLSELYAIFLIKVSFRVEICFSMLILLNNFLLTISFVIRCSFNSAILMPSMRQMLQCRNTSSLFLRDVWSAYLSHPHGNELIGIVRKMRYSLQLLTLASVQKLARAPIDAFLASRCVSMS